ncbi:hypothetical protein ASD24_29470 [Paenibacillus sp. Root52]|uniref:hypothetical protein n=1 Tax=Paenibacillus sp. Root52 TaxID=1736552 RepID=UPI0006F51134|nr:hypothetical protein [Paenibacillus sp. Root52]KQY83739.1 hypothetical protein ASD24_29470 [Paenibacillus sp. Root52]
MTLTLADIRQYKSWAGNVYDAGYEFDQNNLLFAQRFILLNLESKDDYSTSLLKLVKDLDLSGNPREDNYVAAIAILHMGFLEICKHNRISNSTDLIHIDSVRNVVSQVSQNATHYSLDVALAYNLASFVCLQMSFGFYLRKELSEILWDFNGGNHQSALSRIGRYTTQLVLHIESKRKSN